MLSFLFSGLFLFRLAARTFLCSLFHEPPRNTPAGAPTRHGARSRARHLSESAWHVSLRLCLVQAVFFNQPPSSLPISTSSPAAYRYWATLVSLRAWLSRT